VEVTLEVKWLAYINISLKIIVIADGKFRYRIYFSQNIYRR
jgi:hypothetical protein